VFGFQVTLDERSAVLWSVYFPVAVRENGVADPRNREPPETEILARTGGATVSAALPAIWPEVAVIVTVPW
jgi:hypothetical protein